MGRKKRKKREAVSPPAPVGRGRVLVLVAIVAVAGVLAFVTWRKTPTVEVTAPHAASAAAPRVPPRSAAAPATTGEAPEVLRPLLGEWLRPDGGYVLVVQGIADDGSATVAYLNPRPINVERATARSEDGTAELFVELRDQGYPGSTYTLSHDPGADQLKGIYFQATQRASYDVVFVRR